MPELDGEGGQSVCSGSKAANTMKLPQTRKTHPFKSPLGDLWTPLLNTLQTFKFVYLSNGCRWGYLTCLR